MSPPTVLAGCFPCGDVLPGLRFARCWRCAVGWRLACRLPVPVWGAEARASRARRGNASEVIG